MTSQLGSYYLRFISGAVRVIGSGFSDVGSSNAGVVRQGSADAELSDFRMLERPASEFGSPSGVCSNALFCRRVPV